MADQLQPALKKLDLTIARLRLLLADLNARDAAVDAQRHTFNAQRHKLINHALYGEATLDNVLGMLADVEERLASTEATAKSLQAIRARAEMELESLQLTKSIEEAKVSLLELQELQARNGAGESDSRSAIEAEIGRLQALINEASERAAQTIEKSMRKA